jgi:hypothetical protein
VALFNSGTLEVKTWMMMKLKIFRMAWLLVKFIDILKSIDCPSSPSSVYSLLLSWSCGVLQTTAAQAGQDEE